MQCRSDGQTWADCVQNGHGDRIGPPEERGMSDDFFGLAPDALLRLVTHLARIRVVVRA